jgi:ABC-type phosphate/phosphonate transport system substrate-binding protein
MINHTGNHKSHPAWNKGLAWPPEVRDKISQAMLAYWQIDHEEKLVRRVEILRQATLLSWRTNREERLRILRKNMENRWQRQEHT